jgi:hypothetical protein
MNAIEMALRDGEDQKTLVEDHIRRAARAEMPINGCSQAPFGYVYEVSGNFRSQQANRNDQEEVRKACENGKQSCRLRRRKVEERYDDRA